MTFQTHHPRPLSLKGRGESKARMRATAPLMGVGLAVCLVLGLNHSSSGGGAEGGAGGVKPIKVEPHDVALTVLSVAETEGETLYMPILQKLGQMAPAVSPLQPVVQQVVFDGKRARRGYFPPAITKLTGQALVKDRRLITNLKEGDNLVRFTEVAATIDPTSVRFFSDTDPDGTQVVEQNFEYDLVNADALLKRYLDKKVICVFKDGKEASGYLMAHDEGTMVLASEPPRSPPLKGGGKKTVRSTQVLERSEIQAIRLNEVPKDLLVKPTLVWKVRTKKAGDHEVTVTYLCGFIKWKADYVVLVHPSEDLNPDLLDITGWVSLDNQSGAAYDKAGLKLIAGDVNRKRDPWASPPVRDEWMYERNMVFEKAKSEDRDAKAPPKEFVEKSFFEYHLYTLSAPSTIKDKQIKQLNLLHKEQVKASRRYIYDPQMDPKRLAIELVAKNEKENNLGVPLPKGRVTFEQKDVDGESGVLGQLDIDHTAVKEELSLKYGYAFDVAGEFKQLNYQQINPRHYLTTNEIRVRNHKTTEIQVRAIARLGSNWKITKNSLAFEEHDFQTVYFNFLLKPNTEQVITYTVDYEY